MRGLQRLLFVAFVLLVIGMTTVIVVRATAGRQVGPPVTVCPGPDEYGYVCAPGDAVTYIDASTDTMLYQDDGLVELDLPFTFTFYGTEYDQVQASSNGNLLFAADSVWFENECLNPQPAADMGDMIAPYWDDLDLTFEGALQTEIVGQSPDRIFVVEWDDVPKFGGVDDRVTFEVQLFEGSNDIVFAYADARTFEGASGSEATIGMQSEAQGYALQVSCNQHAVHDGSVVRFVHPDEPVAAGLSYVPSPSGAGPALAAVEKSRANLVAQTLNNRGREGLLGLQAAWLGQRPGLRSEWLWADMDGDGWQEAVVLMQGAVGRPEVAELAIIGRDVEQQWRLQWHDWPLARQDRLQSLRLAAVGDVTGDGADEIVLRDPAGEQLLALTTELGDFTLVPVPGRCRGSMVLRDVDLDGVLEIVSAGCPGGGRQTVDWSGESFSIAVER
jgi:hypothetical protein